MYTVLVIFAVIVCVLLVLLILIQNPKGGGISPTFGGFNQMLGAKKSGDVVERSTWYLAGALLVICLLTAFVKPTVRVQQEDKSIEESINRYSGPSQIPGSGILDE